MLEVEYVFVVNGVWTDLTSYDNVFVVNKSGPDLNPSDYKQVYIINGVREETRPAKYRNVRITNGLPDRETDERVYVSNFEALKEIDSIREKFFPQTVKCAVCGQFFEVGLFERGFVSCPRCGYRFLR